MGPSDRLVHAVGGVGLGAGLDQDIRAPALQRAPGVDGGADTGNGLVTVDDLLALGVATFLRRHLVLDHDTGEAGLSVIPSCKKFDSLMVC